MAPHVHGHPLTYLFAYEGSLVEVIPITLEFDSKGLGCDPRIYISTKFPGGANAAGPGPQFENYY